MSDFVAIKAEVIKRVEELTQLPQVNGHKGAAYAGEILGTSDQFYVTITRNGTSEVMRTIGRGGRTDRSYGFDIEVELPWDKTAAAAKEVAFDAFLEALCDTFREDPALGDLLAKARLPQIMPDITGFRRFKQTTLMRYRLITLECTESGLRYSTGT